MGLGVVLGLGSGLGSGLASGLGESWVKYISTRIYSNLSFAQTGKPDKDKRSVSSSKFLPIRPCYLGMGLGMVLGLGLQLGKGWVLYIRTHICSN